MHPLLSARMIALHVLGTIAVGAAGWLGWWQVAAWQDNREDRAAALADADPIPLDEAIGPDDPFPSRYVGQPVEVSGTWVPGTTVYVANKQIEGRDGYWVVTPVSTPTGSAVPVVRGWSPEPASADVGGTVELTGWLQPGEALDAGAELTRDDILGSLRIADILERLDQDTYGGYVMARAAESGLTPVTPDQLPKPDTFTSIRNLLYGIEWWVFAAFAGFLWWRWCRDEVERVRSATEQVESAEEAPDAPVPSSP